MSGEEMIVALVGTIAGVGLIGYLSSKIFGLIREWINRNNNAIPEESFDRLAKAFMEHKKNTDRRLQNLEAIISDQKQEATSGSSDQSKQIEAPQKTIEIEDQEMEEQESNSNNDTNLRNMLRE